LSLIKKHLSMIVQLLSNSSVTMTLEGERNGHNNVAVEQIVLPNREICKVILLL
jgi:hypothetical protein